MNEIAPNGMFYARGGNLCMGITIGFEPELMPANALLATLDFMIH